LIAFYKYSLAKLLQKLLSGRAYPKIFDLGCGPGFFAPILARHCRELIGLDANKEFLLMAGGLGLYSKLIKVNFCEKARAPLYCQAGRTGGSGDAFFLLDVIEHLPESCALCLLGSLPGEIWLSTPVEFHPNWLGKVIYGELHRHLSFWPLRKLKALGFSRFWFFAGRRGLLAWRAPQ